MIQVFKKSLSSAATVRPGSAAVLLVLALWHPVYAQDEAPLERDCRADSNDEGWICGDSATLDALEPTPPPPQGDIEAAAARALAATGTVQLDWAPIADVPPELYDHKCISCDGRYLDPLADADTSIKPDLSDIEASASETTLQGNTVTLSGGVKVSQGYRQLSGDNATFNRDTQQGSLSGNIILREPGALFVGDSAEFDSRTGEASIKNSEFVLHELNFRGAAGDLRRDQEGLIHIEDGALSYCAPDQEDWSIRANSMELDTVEGVGVARGAKLELGGVPVFYMPWLRFPLDDSRRTGVLWPSLGSDSKGGVDIAVPVYLNLAPNYDALYIPRYIQERGVNHEIDLRYLNPYIGHWSVGGAFMEDDKRYEDEFPDERSYDRWLVSAQHNGLFEQRWRSKVDYARASDTNYLKDLDSSSLENKRATSLLQLGSLDYLGDQWLFEAEVQQFQSLADDISNDYKKLPQLSARYRGDQAPFAIDPILFTQYSYFDTDDERVTGQRVYAEAGASYPMQWTYGFLKPLLKYRQLEYDLSDPIKFADNSSPSTGAALANLDAGLLFDRQTRIGGKSLIQTLEPRMYYLYSDYEEQSDQPDFDSAELTFSYNQLFRETRFSGHDRIDDANQLSMGVTTRFIDDSDGQEYLSASLGQIFYFEDRRVRLNPNGKPLTQSGSEIAAEVTFRPDDKIDVRSSLLWDPYSGKMQAGYVQANYSLDNGTVVNAGYTYRRPLPGFNTQPVTEQVNLSTYLPIASNWSLFAAWNYSIEADTSIEDMYGLEYDTCCWMVRLMHLRYFDNIPGTTPDFNDPNLERENSTQIQLVLKGMGGFGNRVSGILEDMIRGFNEREF
ncbi:MAG: LPS-assembly protein LptD [Halioglobus sp.]